MNTKTDEGRIFIAPAAIFIAGMSEPSKPQNCTLTQRVILVIGTGLIGWLLNIVLVLCSGSLYVFGVSDPLSKKEA